MTVRLLNLLFVAAFFLMPVTVHAQDSSPVGAIAAIEGTATLSHGGAVSDAAIGDAIHPGDELVTAPGAKAHILFIDETEITLGSDASLQVTEYLFDPATAGGNKGRFSVLRGAFIFVSGLIAKSGEPDVAIETPHGSVGIRGTTVWGGAFDDEYGILVLDGEVIVKTARATRRVGTNQGTFLRDSRSIPTRAAVWSPDRVDAAIKTVTLQNPDEVKARVAEMKKQHAALRAGHKQNTIRRQEEKEEQQREIRRERQEKRQEENKEMRRDIEEKEPEPGLHQTTPEQFLQNETGYDEQQPPDDLNKPIDVKEAPVEDVEEEALPQEPEPAPQTPRTPEQQPQEQTPPEPAAAPLKEGRAKERVLEEKDMKTPVEALLKQEETTTRHRMERMEEQLEELRESENSAHEMELKEKHHMENRETETTPSPKQTGSSRGF